MAIEENKALATKLIENLSNVDMVVPMLHDNLVWTVMGDPELFPAAGACNREQQIEVLGNMSSLAPDGVTMTILGITAEGDRVALEASGKAVFVNGTPYNNNYHFLVEVKDGKIYRVKEYCDTLLAITAMSTLASQE